MHPIYFTKITKTNNFNTFLTQYLTSELIPTKKAILNIWPNVITLLNCLLPVICNDNFFPVYPDMHSR
jgi:hypothetical protein